MAGSSGVDDGDIWLLVSACLRVMDDDIIG
jgi:hypothetical protein